MSTLLSNIAAYYQLENNGNDSTGTGNDLTTIVNVSFSLANGKINIGAGFSGNGRLERTVSTLLTGTGNSRSISCWFKTSSAPASGVRQIVQTSNGFTGFPSAMALIILTTGVVGCGTYGGGFVSTGIVCTDGLWHHLVATYDTTTLRVYLDNVFRGSSNTTIQFINQTIIVGAQNSTTNFWVGEIDEIGIWTRALTVPEISELYNANAGLTYPFTPPITESPSFLFNLI